MCMNSAPKVDNSYQNFAISEAQRSRAEEQARQAEVDRGMQEIRAVFEGGQGAPKGFLDRLENQNVHTWDAPLEAGKPSTGKIVGGQVVETPGKNGAPSTFTPQPGQKQAVDIVKASPAAQQLNRMALNTSAKNPSYKGFGAASPGETYEGIDPLLAERRKAMEGFYLPQIDKSYDDAREELTFALTRAGLGTSTTAERRKADLAEGFSLEKAGVLSDIDRDLSSARTGYNQQRANLEAQLRASGDSRAAANAALSSRAAFAQDAPTLSPLVSTLGAFAQNIGAGLNGFRVGQVERIAGGGAMPINRDTGRIVKGI